VDGQQRSDRRARRRLSRSVACHLDERDRGNGVRGGSLTKTAATVGQRGCGIDGVRSGLVTGTCRVSPARRRRAACSGSATGDTDQSYQDIDFAITSAQRRTPLTVYEDGVSRGSFGPLRRATCSAWPWCGVVRTARTGQSSTRAPVAAERYPLLVDTALMDQAARSRMPSCLRRLARRGSDLWADVRNR